VQPEEVLKLIGSASRRYDTVRAALRYRSDGTTRRKIRERMARTEAGRRGRHLRRGRPHALLGASRRRGTRIRDGST
jgi:hypothetical protein